MQKDIALYVHIPFCVKKCNYCDFLSFSSDDDTKRKYLDALYRESIFWKNKLSGRYRIKTVFVGGGTPTCLLASELERLGDIIKQFDIDDNAEFTIEANPGTLDNEKINAIKKMGVNRVSLGLQSTVDKELKLLGRIHTYEEFLESYHLLRDAGFDNINIDLMSDIPKQSFESYRKTLERVVSLKPEHISSYSLIIEPGTVFYRMYEDGILDIADEDTDRQMYSYTKKFLEENGYHRYEISNYCKKDRECKHNLVYWNLDDYIGIGLGASSYFEGARFSNFSEMKKYQDIMYSDKTDNIVHCDKVHNGSMYFGKTDNIEYCDKSNNSMYCDKTDNITYCDKSNEFNVMSCDVGGSNEKNEKNRMKASTVGCDFDTEIKSKVESYEKLTEKAKMEEFMFVGLRKCIGVSKTEFKNRFNYSIDEIYGDVIDKFIKNNLLSENDNSDRIYLTDKGIDLSNYILSEFLL